jgi:hypothetical protein
MMKYLAPLIFALLFGAATACAENAQGETVPAPSAEDLKIIAMLEILQMMDLAEEMDMVKEMDYLIEDRHDERE